MKASIAAAAVLFAMALAQKTTFLCRDISNNVMTDGSICTGSGGKHLGKGICCIAKSDALAQAKFDIACDDKLGTSQSTGEACEA
ncbi:hypothetical protein C8034_v003131 [Colletotrichum sidae]|uniref:Uncharacterized protein n=1 Tax=Colletotrichum sidae TaxID=1347389 RepID=A0A4R8TAT1_9PEZI|nr:hypothetical protein C8034_v003131 [Colletotrichum sidae]